MRLPQVLKGRDFCNTTEYRFFMTSGQAHVLLPSDIPSGSGVQNFIILGFTFGFKTQFYKKNEKIRKMGVLFQKNIVYLPRF
jgi:hypothetical protein